MRRNKALCRVNKNFDTIGMFTTQYQLLTTLYIKPLENIVGKGENADN